MEMDPFREDKELLASFRPYSADKIHSLFKNFPLLQLHTRLHGLPVLHKASLFRLICNGGTTAKDALILSQTLKYAARHDPKFATFTDLIDTVEQLVSIHPIEKLGDEEDDDRVLVQHVVTEIMRTVCEILGKDAKTIVQKQLEIIEKYEKYYDDEVRLQRFQMTQRLLQANEEGRNDDNDCENEVQMGKKNKYKGGLLHHPQLIDSLPPKPHAVRVQTQSTTTSQALSSEKSPLAQLSLTNVLNARARSIATTMEKEPLPPSKSKSGSDRGWITTTAQDVETLVNLAGSKSPVSGEDQTYLFDKLNGAHYVITADRNEVYRQIAEAFYQISGTQMISTELSWKLMNEMRKRNDFLFCKKILLCAQRTFVRSPSYYEEYDQKCLMDRLSNTDCFKPAEADEIKSIILEIITEQEANSSNAISNAEWITKTLDTAAAQVAGINTTEKVRETSCRILNLHSFKASSISWFNQKGGRKLVEILVDENVPLTFRKNAAEILENCWEIEDFSGLDEKEVSKLGNLLNELDTESESDILNVVLRLLLKCSEKHELSPSALNSLVKCCLNSNSLRIQSVILSALKEFSEKEILPKNVELLSILLLDPRVLWDGLKEDEKDDEEEDELPTISALTAAILLSCVELGGQRSLLVSFKEETILHCLHSLESSEDKQTRITVSELLEKTLDLSQNLSGSLLTIVRNYINDETPDVKINCRIAFLKSAQKLSKTQCLEKSLVETSSSLFAFSPLVWNRINIGEKINRNILKILKNQGGKEGTQFGTVSMNLLHHLFINQEMDGLFVMKILHSYCGKGEKLPKKLVDVVSTLMSSDGEVGDVAKQIIFSLIRQGRKVNEHVLTSILSEIEKLSEEFFDGDKQQKDNDVGQNEEEDGSENEEENEEAGSEVDEENEEAGSEVDEENEEDGSEVDEANEEDGSEVDEENEEDESEIEEEKEEDGTENEEEKDNSTVKEKYLEKLNLLLQINRNQDLGEAPFQLLKVELLCGKMISETATEIGWKTCDNYIENGGKPGLNLLLLLISKLEKGGADASTAMNFFTLIAERGGKVPSLVFDHFTLQADISFLKVAEAVGKRSQVFRPPFIHACFETLQFKKIDKEFQISLAAFLLGVHQRNGNVPITLKQFSQLQNIFSNSTTSNDIVELLLPIFLSYFQEGEQGLDGKIMDYIAANKNEMLHILFNLMVKRGENTNNILKSMSFLITKMGARLGQRELEEMVAIFTSKGTLNRELTEILKSILTSQFVTKKQAFRLEIIQVIAEECDVTFLEKLTADGFTSAHEKIHVSCVLKEWPELVNRLFKVLKQDDDSLTEKALSLIADHLRCDNVPSFDQTLMEELCFLFTSISPQISQSVKNFCKGIMINVLRKSEETIAILKGEWLPVLEDSFEESLPLLQIISGMEKYSPKLQKRTKYLLQLEKSCESEDSLLEFLCEMDDSKYNSEIFMETAVILLLRKLETIDVDLPGSIGANVASVLANALLNVEIMVLPKNTKILRYLLKGLMAEENAIKLIPICNAVSHFCDTTLPKCSKDFEEDEKTLFETVLKYLLRKFDTTSQSYKSVEMAPIMKCLCSLALLHPMKESEEMLLENVFNPIGCLRHLACTGLRHLVEKNLIQDFGNTVSTMDSLLQRILQQLGNSVSKESTFSKVMSEKGENTLRLLEVLLLVENLNVGTLQKQEISVEKIERELLVSEILSIYSAKKVWDVTNKISLLSKLKLIIDQDNYGTRILADLILLLNTESFHQNNLHQVLDVLIAISPEIGVRLLRFPMILGPGWLPQFEQNALKSLLNQQESYGKKKDELQNLVKNLQDKIGVVKCIQLIGRLGSTCDLSELEIICNICSSQLDLPENLIGNELKHFLWMAAVKTACGKFEKKCQNQIVPKLSILLSHGADFCSILKLINVIGNSGRDIGAILVRILFNNYTLIQDKVTQLTHLLEENDSKTWIRLTSQFVNDSVHGTEKAGGTLKGISEIVKEFAANGGKSEDAAFSLELEELIRKVQTGNARSIIAKMVGKRIKDWDDKDITLWAKALRANPLETFDHISTTELITVGNRAFQLAKMFRLTSVQILSIYSALTKGLPGRLLQVATGSGKSAIIAITAALTSLRGNFKIDIVTSSPVLARRDAESWTKFYGQFGLSCSYNCDPVGGLPYIKGPKSCYSSDIIYGEISDFQFDILRDEYSDLGTLAGRKSEFAIVDEVDSLLLDDISKLARLSGPVPGMDCLQLIYHMVWHRLLHLESKLFTLDSKTFFIEGKIIYSGESEEAPPSLEVVNKDKSISTVPDLITFLRLGEQFEEAGVVCLNDVSAFVQKHLTEFLTLLIDPHKGEKVMVKVPRHLHQFATSQISKWIESCITAYTYQENVEYVVDKGLIKPVDFATTGIVQAGTAWSDGLHQFLQLKHSLKLTSESVTTNFLSNKSFFQRYNKTFAVFGREDCGVVGLSGTLGNERTRELMWNLYRTRSTDLPDSYRKQFLQYPDIYCERENKWREEIVESVKAEILRGRGTLIVCETIKQAHKIESAIKTAKYQRLPEFFGIKVYTKNDADQEEKIEKIMPGEVFIATNLAGRGTDIITKKIEENGGLHVILTFLPGNERVENQAFGRTARQGKRGTGQLICVSQLQKDPREKRDLLEEKRFEEFENKDLKLVIAKDECFAKFCKFLQKCRNKIKSEMGVARRAQNAVNKISQGIGKLVQNPLLTTSKTVYSLLTGAALDEATINILECPPLNVLESCVLQALEERWSLFLRQLDLGRIPPEDAAMYYAGLQMKLALDFRKVPNHSSVIRTPFYHIIIANDFFSRGKFVEQAQAHFRKAIEWDPDFATGAFMGLGFSLLKEGKGSRYKTEAVSLLEKAMETLQNEMGTHLSALNILKMRNTDSPESALQAQLEMKIGLCGSVSNSVGGVLKAASDSLRPIDFIQTNKQSGQKEGINYFSIEGRIDDTKNFCSQFLQTLEGHEINLKFNNLTFHSDMGTNDQIVETLKAADLKGKEGSFLLAETGFSNLLTLISPDACLLRVGKEEAFTAIETWDKLYTSTFDKVNLLKTTGNFSVYKYKDEKTIESLGTQLLVKNAKSLVEASGENDFFNISYTGGNKSVSDHFKTVTITAQNLTGNDVKLLRKHVENQYKIPDLAILLSKKEDFAILQNVEDLEMTIRVTKPNGKCWTTFKHNDLPLNWSDDDGYEANIKNISSQNLSKILDNFKENKASIFSLTLWDLESKTLLPDCSKQSENGKNALKNYLSSLTLQISVKTKDKIDSTVKCLRDKGIPVILQIQNLSVERALSVIQSAKMAQEDMEMSKEIKNTHDFYTIEYLPLTEFAEFAARGILLLCEFAELRPIPYWSICTVLAIGALQTGFGVVLLCSGFGASVGLTLIAEGVSDFRAAYKAYSTREFNWTSYGIQKAVSYTLMVCTVGMSGLKDAAKGVSVAYQGLANSFVNAGASQIAVQGSLQVTKQSLVLMAAKQVGISVGQMIAREGFNQLVDYGTQWAMSSIKPELKKNVSTKVRNIFLTPDINGVMTLLWALDQVKGTHNLERKVRSTIKKITHPQYDQLWNSVALPLCQGILSDPNYLGSRFAAAMRICGILKGIHQISTLLGKVQSLLLEELRKENTSVLCLLNIHGKLPLKEAQRLKEFVSPIRVEGESYSKFETTFPKDAAPKTLETFFKNLNEKQKEFQLEKIDSLIKSVVDEIAEYTLKTVDSQMIKPVSTFAVGRVVADISSCLEQKFLVTDDKSKTVAEELRSTQGKFQLLYADEEKRLENAAIIKQAEQANGDGGGGLSTTSPQTVAAAIGTATTAPAGITEMEILLNKHKIDAVLSDDPNYKPSEAEVASGKAIMKYIPGAGGDIGHYQVYDKESGAFVNAPSSGSFDCGYDVISSLTGVPVSDLRKEAAEFIINHPKEFTEIKENELIILSHHPKEEWNKALFIGGKEIPKLEEIQAKYTSEKRINEDEQIFKEAFVKNGEKDNEFKINPEGGEYKLKRALEAFSRCAFENTEEKSSTLEFPNGQKFIVTKNSFQDGNQVMVRGEGMKASSYNDMYSNLFSGSAEEQKEMANTLLQYLNSSADNFPQGHEKENAILELLTVVHVAENFRPTDAGVVKAQDVAKAVRGDLPIDANTPPIYSRTPGSSDLFRGFLRSVDENGTSFEAFKTSCVFPGQGGTSEMKKAFVTGEGSEDLYNTTEFVSESSETENFPKG